jgi:hypothetical protein
MIRAGTGMAVVLRDKYLRGFELRRGGCAVEKLVELLAGKKIAAGKDLSRRPRRWISSS